MIGRLFTLISLLCLLSACSPITKHEDEIRLPQHPQAESEASKKQKKQNEDIPFFTKASEDLKTNKLCIAYGNKVTGLSNAYLRPMDNFFKAFRQYYVSLGAYKEDPKHPVEFQKVQLRPKLTSQQIEWSEKFGAVPFLDRPQNEFVLNSLITLQKRMMDLDLLSTELQEYVDRKAYESDDKLIRGQEMMFQINDHCAEFYETHHNLGDFIESVQLVNKRPILLFESDGEASLHLLNDLHNLKKIIKRVGNYRKDSDNIEELIAEYKLLAQELQSHTKYDLELIKSTKAKKDYQAFYNGVYAEILPRMNKTIEELQNENLIWLKQNFNQTVEEMYGTYNRLSRFYTSEYGKVLAPEAQ